MSLSSCSRRLSVAPRQVWSDKGADHWVVEVLRWGYHIPFRRAPTLSKEPIPGVQPPVHQGQGLGGGGSFSVKEGSDRAGSPPVSGVLQPAVCGDESLRRVEAGHRPLATESEGSEDILQDGNSQVSTSFGTGWRLDGISRLRDVYLQVPMHPDLRKFLRFVACGKVYQFKVLCFGLSTAPQVFTRVMAPVSAFLHRTGIRLRRYLDDWLIQASSREQVLLALDTVLQLCHSLGIVVNWEKSQLIPTQHMVYLGVLLDSISFRASPALKRVEKLLSIGDVFLSCEEQPVSSWLELLELLSSMIQLVPGGRLRMRSLQFVLRRSWDHVDQSVVVRWTPEVRSDLE